MEVNRGRRALGSPGMWVVNLRDKEYVVDRVVEGNQNLVVVVSVSLTRRGHKVEG